MKQKKTSYHKIFLFPLTLAVIFFASIIIIFSPVGKKNIITLPSPTPTPAFICPSNEWIDCMPGPGSVKVQCQTNYLDWVKVNCPNFKGVAY